MKGVFKKIQLRSLPSLESHSKDRSFPKLEINLILGEGSIENESSNLSL